MFLNRTKKEAAPTGSPWTASAVQFRNTTEKSETVDMDETEKSWLKQLYDKICVNNTQPEKTPEEKPMTNTDSERIAALVIIIRDPSTPHPSGRAYALPVFACIAEIDFANKAAIQQVSRIGAPIILPKVIDTASAEDYRDRQDWFAKWGSLWGTTNASLIPPGIEFPNLQIRETTTAAEFIQRRVEWIRTYFNPMSAMQDAGAGIGTSDSGRMEMWATFIAAEQSRAEEWLERIYDECLDANGYEKYHAHIRLKRPSVDKAQLKIQAITELARDHAILLSEIRDNMTDILDLRETTPDVELELKNQYPDNSAFGMFGNVGGRLSRQASTPWQSDSDTMPDTMT